MKSEGKAADSLLQRFLLTGWDSFFVDLLREALEEKRLRPDVVMIRSFERDLWEVTLDFANGTARIDDVLDASPEGTEEVELSRFVDIVLGSP